MNGLSNTDRPAAPKTMRFFALLMAGCSAALGENVKSAASMVTDVTSIASGESFMVALKLDHPDGWHSFYRNSGGVERPLEITWDLPEGATAIENGYLLTLERKTADSLGEEIPQSDLLSGILVGEENLRVMNVKIIESE